MLGPGHRVGKLKMSVRIEVERQKTTREALRVAVQLVSEKGRRRSCAK